MKWLPKTLLGRMFLFTLLMMVFNFLLVWSTFAVVLTQPAGHWLATVSQSLMSLVGEAKPRRELLAQLHQQNGMVIIDNADQRYDAPPDLPLFNSLQNTLNQAEGGLVLRLQPQPDSKLWLLHTTAPAFSLGIPVGDLGHTPVLLRLIFLGNALLSAMVAYLIARHLTAPLKNLAEGAKLIGRELNYVAINPSGPVEIREVGQALNEVQANLDHLVKEQEFLLAGISHDLRTPLARIRMATELIADDTDDLKHGMKDDIEEMSAILKRFIELARVNIEETEPWKIGEITPLLQDVAKKYQRAEVTLTLSLDVDNVPRVRYKPMALRRLLYNLIDNGIKHGGGQVKLSTQRQGDKMALSVSDQGGGLPKTATEQQAYSDVNDTQIYGNGLGLRIVQRLAQLHDAELTLRNTPQGGAEIIMRLNVYADAN
ncbi:HAMP domain-containing protein [Methylovulum psychrotolerans]|uniref:ATP-binding protein n=1 Tax=Methylovulum psychrotolerans TaxID=1704499 RepID=UPI001BFF0C59|nr:ATP-binding protein [Methylovulum psychrotolerans]MBT9100519.1 HAMP domain-containing protein [Methylovulum psychrotolerans]